MESQAVVETIQKARAIAVLRAPDAAGAVKACAAMQAGGLAIMEITTTTPGWEEAIGEVVRAGQQVVGLGTAVAARQVRAACAQGAAFIVSPGFSLAVADACAEEGVPYFPGIATPTELMTAQAHPAVAALKLFPAQALGGAAYLKALRGPFPEASFVPTGGINAENAADYFAAGAMAVGLSAICKGHLIEAGDWDSVTRLTRDFLAAIAA